jgi:nicotinamide-nucleotide amidase
VHFAAVARGGTLEHHQRNYGDAGRTRVRRASVAQALAMLQALAEKEV